MRKEQKQGHWSLPCFCLTTENVLHMNSEETATHHNHVIHCHCLHFFFFPSCWCVQIISSPTFYCHVFVFVYLKSPRHSFRTLFFTFTVRHFCDRHVCVCDRSVTLRCSEHIFFNWTAKANILTTTTAASWLEKNVRVITLFVELRLEPQSIPVQWLVSPHRSLTVIKLYQIMSDSSEPLSYYYFRLILESICTRTFLERIKTFPTPSSGFNPTIRLFFLVRNKTKLEIKWNIFLPAERSALETTKCYWWLMTGPQWKAVYLSC